MIEDGKYAILVRREPSINNVTRVQGRLGHREDLRRIYNTMGREIGRTGLRGRRPPSPSSRAGPARRRATGVVKLQDRDAFGRTAA